MRRHDHLSGLVRAVLTIMGAVFGGTYTFTLQADDGAALHVGNTFKLDNDGLHGMDDGVTASVSLKKGTCPIRLTYFEKAVDEGLTCSWSRPGRKRQFLSVSDGASTAIGQQRNTVSAFRETSVTNAGFPGRRVGRPNIVLIMADDLGYECIGANGGTSYRTPVIDKLAHRGVRFEHCYSQPLCTPSRVQIMTGIYNVRNYAKFGVLPRGETTFAHLLKKGGYATCIAGKWQLGNQPDAARHFGFDASCLWQHTVRGNKTDGYDNRYVNPTIDFDGKTIRLTDGSFGPDVCAEFICDFMEKHKTEPFFIYYPMILTHCPFVPTPDSADWDANSKGSPSYKGDAKYFGDMVTYMDRTVGRITAKLDKLGLRDNTLIIFTGDNGTDVPVVSTINGREVAGGKGLMTDAGTRVPLIANWPAVIRPGQVCQDLVDFSDFLPTLCEAAGTAIPSTLKTDGRSFLPQLMGAKGNPRGWIYCWYSRNGATTGKKEWARNQRYKLYRTGEFYDISKDVLETDPLIDVSVEMQQVRRTLQHALDQYKDARPAHVESGRKQK